MAMVDKTHSFTAYYATPEGKPGTKDYHYEQNLRAETPKKLLEVANQKCPKDMVLLRVIWQAGGLGSRVIWRTLSGKKPEAFWVREEVRDAFKA